MLPAARAGAIFPGSWPIGGQRPCRVPVDPADDGASVVFAVGDRVRRDYYRRIRLSDLLPPANRLTDVNGALR